MEYNMKSKISGAIRINGLENQDRLKDRKILINPSIHRGNSNNRHTPNQCGKHEDTFCKNSIFQFHMTLGNAY
jgi:hypothetical protein